MFKLFVSWNIFNFYSVSMSEKQMLISRWLMPCVDAPDLLSRLLPCCLEIWSYLDGPVISSIVGFSPILQVAMLPSFSDLSQLMIM